MKKVLFSIVAIALVLALSASAVVAGSSPNLVTNGDFEHSAFSGWTRFLTINGTANNHAIPVVESFDTNGDSSANLSAKFSVGQSTTLGAGIWEGGGIFQMVSAPAAGPWTASADIAAITTAYNQNGGLFELIVDSVVVASYNVSSIAAGATDRSTLSASGTFGSAGSYEIRIKITRPHTTSSTTPKQYVDNVVLQMTATLVDVDIDIKPGSFPNSINLNSKGRVPVAILTTAVFDALTVDPVTVAFGPAGAAPVRWAAEDVDYDGDLDLVLHFKTQETGIVAGDTEATLTGETFGGAPISGTDSVRTIPQGP